MPQLETENIDTVDDSPNKLAELLGDDDADDDEDTDDSSDTDDESTDNSESKESDESESDGVDEDKEDEEEDEELEDSDDEEEELDEEDEISFAPRRQEILKEFPKIFEKFPYLEKALYKTQKYEEIYSTPEDAQHASETLGNYQQLENEVTQTGKLTSILRAVKNVDENTFYQVADNYLDSLRETDRNAYFHVAGNIIKTTIMEMARAGQSSKNDTLSQSAQILHQFAFGPGDWQPPSKLSKEPDPKSNELQNEKEQFIQQKFEHARDGLDNRVKSKVNALIKNNIDPKESMTDYVRRTASRDVFEQVQEHLSNDDEFTSHMNRLWEKAFESDFSSQSLNKIFNAYNTKAKTVLPKFIKKARADALKGLGKRVKTTKNRSRHLPSSEKTASRNSSGKNKPDSQKTTLEIFNED